MNNSYLQEYRYPSLTAIARDAWRHYFHIFRWQGKWYEIWEGRAFETHGPMGLKFRIVGEEKRVSWCRRGDDD